MAECSVPAGPTARPAVLLQAAALAILASAGFFASADASTSVRLLQLSAAGIQTLPPPGSALWRLDTAPLLTLRAESVPGLLAFARIVSVSHTGAGQIVIAAQGTGGVYVFDEQSGSFVNSWKGGGGGGANSAPFGLLAGATGGRGDTVHVYDAAMAQLLHFTVGGGPYGVTRIHMQPLAERLGAFDERDEFAVDSIGPLTLTPGGGLLVQTVAVPNKGPLFPSVFMGRDTASYAWLPHPTEGASVRLGRLARGTKFETAFWFNLQETRISSDGVADYGNSYVAHDPTGTRTCFGDGAVPRVTCVNRDGSRMQFSWSHTPVPVAADFADTVRGRLADIVRRSGSNRPTLTLGQVQAALTAVRTPEYEKVFTNLLMDSELNVWVELVSRRSRSRRTSIFSVFDSAGVFVADIAVPSISFVVRDIQGDRLTASTGPSSYPEVQVFRIIKP